MKKNIVAAVIVAVGMLAAAYVGLWWGLYGGIVKIVDGVTGDPVSGPDIASGALRALFCPTIGWIMVIGTIALADYAVGRERRGR